MSVLPEMNSFIHRRSWFIVFYYGFCVVFGVVGFCRASDKYDLLIKDGMVIDGSGKPAFKADVAVNEGKVVRIGELQDEQALISISAKGRVVCPGFIDVHTHVDFNIEKNPKCENFAQMGVTTVIAGNCGTSSYPLGKWFDTIEKIGVSINVGSLVGHNTARNIGMGIKSLLKREPNPEELGKMCGVVDEGMKAGALGFSTGLIYLPGLYAKTDEIITLAKVAGKYGRPYVTHMRDEGNSVLKSINEALTIGREAGCPVQISHFKIASKKLWGHNNESIQAVEEAQKNGQKVMVDEYLYTASNSQLVVLFPESLTIAGLDDARKKLEDPAFREEIKKQLISKTLESGFEDFSYVYLANFQPKPEFNGKNITEITKIVRQKSGINEEAEELIDLLLKDNCSTIFHKMSEEDLEQFLVQPFTMIASDASTKGGGNDVPHPRGFGNNARLLGHYVREKKLLTLENAIAKMTSIPADTFKIPNRGYLKNGIAADIVIFDPETIIDRATFENPKQFPVGIDYVIVNGIVVVDHGKHTEAKPGQMIKAL